MIRRISSVAVVFFILFASLSSFAQSPLADSAAIESKIDSLLGKLTLEEKIDLIGGVDSFYIRANEKIGLPRLKMADGPVGVRNYGPSMVFGGIGLAATWDPEMAKLVGMTIGQDARQRGVHFMLGPGVNIYRAPMNGRNFEYFGEDPFLSSQIAVGYIEGMQSQGVSATIKHYMGNNSEFDRHNTDSIIDERTMHEIYLPVFEAAVKQARVGAIMDSYNLINGEHATQNGYLNNEVAKKDWGFKGIIMSDWDATYDGVAAANNGLDLEMPSGKFMNRVNLLPAVKSGKVSQATIDDKVRRILRTAIEFGWLDRDQTELSIPAFNQDGRKVALEAARSGIVLLKNDGNILPLDKGRIKTVAVIGPDAYPAQPGGGGSAEAKPFTQVSYLEGIVNELGPNAKVFYARGLPDLNDVAKETMFTTQAGGGTPGLKEELFHNKDLQGKADVVRTSKYLNYQPARGRGEAVTGFSIRWTGFFTPPTAGHYVAMVQGPGENGGYRLYVDKKLVFDNWSQWYAFVNDVPLDLSAGPHEIEYDYYIKSGWGKVTANLGIVAADSLVTKEAKTLAAQADAVVLAAGFNADSEGESGDRTFALTSGQNELIDQIAAVNKNTIVVMTAGGGVDMSSWIDRVPALLQAWYPGQEGGTAVAQLLFGDFNPSGRLPISIERSWRDNPVRDSYYPKAGSKKVEYKEGIFVGYRYYDKSGVKPLFPFGYGLSYTSFAYKNLTVSSPTAEDGVTIGFDVTNTGSREGADVAEVYVGDGHAPVPCPAKELKGFAKVNLNAGETKHVEVELDRRAFSYYNIQKHDWTVAPGSFNILVGRSSAEIVLNGNVTLQ